MYKWVMNVANHRNQWAMYPQFHCEFANIRDNYTATVRRTIGITIFLNRTIINKGQTVPISPEPRWWPKRNRKHEQYLRISPVSRSPKDTSLNINECTKQHTETWSEMIHWQLLNELLSALLEYFECSYHRSKWATGWIASLFHHKGDSQQRAHKYNQYLIWILSNEVVGIGSFSATAAF